VAQDTYGRLAGLPLTVEGYTLEGLHLDTSSGWERRTTVIHLHGRGCVGAGEDVWTDPDDQLRFLAAGPVLGLAGRWTLDGFSRHLEALGIFPDAPTPTAPGFRRWAFEAAALDLALRQAGAPLSDVLDRVPAPVRWVLSIRLAGPGEASSVAPIRERLAAYPDLRFKLDPVDDWDDTLVARLAEVAGDRIDVLDFKAHYHGTQVDTLPDPALYARCIAAWPRAVIEDPSNDPAVVAVLGPHRDRVSWDAPIHSVDDVTALAYPPRVLNIKPARFGTVRALCAAYDHCAAHRIAMYGGGFFELGPGRGQLQYLASLFHPDGPNDVGPRGFHVVGIPDGMPTSPLAVAAEAAGFAWSDPTLAP
jgi:hypothetical protein